MMLEEMVAHQNFLNSNGAVYMIFSLLSDLSDPKLADMVFNDLITFGIQLLNEGNSEVQKTIF